VKGPRPRGPRYAHSDLHGPAGTGRFLALGRANPEIGQPGIISEWPATDLAQAVDGRFPRRPLPLPDPENFPQSHVRILYRPPGKTLVGRVSSRRRGYSDADMKDAQECVFIGSYEVLSMR
jgi:hypothetical protein